MKNKAISTYLEVPNPPPLKSKSNVTISFAVLFLLALIFFIAIFFSDLRQIYANKEIQNKLKLSQYDDIQKNFQMYSSNSNFLGFLKSFFASSSNQNRAIINEDFLTVLNLVELIDKGNIKKLQKKYLVFKKNSAKRIASKTSSGKAIQWMLKELDSTSTEYFNKTEQWNDVKDSGPKRLQIIEDALKDTGESTFTPGQLELARLFSLDRLLSNKTPGLYKKGILVDLPKIPTIPDNIANLVELKNAIDRAGGRVIIRGENAPARFKKALEGLRELATKSNKTKLKLETEKENIKKELKTLSDYSKIGASKFKKLLFRLLMRSATPELTIVGRTLFDR